MFGKSNMPLILPSIICCGAEGSRTLDLYNANVALSQLSYSPNVI